MSETRRVERNEDMSPDGRLAVLRQPDGDVIIAIIPNSTDLDMGWNPSVEFCTSGGRSPHTRQALYDLFAAIERDNAESPIQGRPSPVEGSDVHAEVAALKSDLVASRVQLEAALGACRTAIQRCEPCEGKGIYDELPCPFCRPYREVLAMTPALAAAVIAEQDDLIDEIDQIAWLQNNVKSQANVIAKLQSDLAASRVQLEAALGACQAVLAVVDTLGRGYPIVLGKRTIGKLDGALAMTPASAGGVIAERDRLREELDAVVDASSNLLDFVDDADEFAPRFQGHAAAWEAIAALKRVLSPPPDPRAIKGCAPGLRKTDFTAAESQAVRDHIAEADANPGPRRVVRSCESPDSRGEKGEADGQASQV